MKGVMSFLERAGLVTQEPDAAAALDSAPVESVTVEPVPAPTPTPVVEAIPVAATGGTLNFADIYAEAGVPGALYPAERLLRLVAGLSALSAGYSVRPSRRPSTPRSFQGSVEGSLIAVTLIAPLPTLMVSPLTVTSPGKRPCTES